MVILLLAVPAAAQDLPDASALFGRGVALHQAGDLLGAIEAYEVALEKEPGRVDARSNLGAAYAQLGRHDQAIEQYRAVLALASDQARVRFNLALALYKSARIADAAAELERVAAQEPSNRRAVLLLADCRAQMGNDAAVVALLTPLEPELGDDRLYAYLLGNALIRSNELLRGRSYIERLFREGDTAQARLLMGAAHLRRGDGASALPELERAAQLEKELPGVHSLIGRALMRMGRREEAVQAFRRELQGNPNDFDANVHLGLFLKDDQKLDEAYEHLKRAARLRPQDPGALYALGALHLAAGRVEEAQMCLETVVGQVPSYASAHVLLATVYYRQKRKAQGDREQRLAEKLRAEQQSREPGAADDLGPTYRGDEAPSPTTRNAKPPSGS